MAETMLVAFGRYLRTLRERRGYSLDDVASLTRLSPDPILKGYLSRCENGKTRIGFSKMNTLCQVYEVPLEVVAERHSLDMELEKVGGPDTERRTFEDLVTSAATASKQGRRWDAYGQIRDALELASYAPLMQGFESVDEQVGCTQMNAANTAAALGKVRFALYELEQLRATGNLGPKYGPVLLDRLALRVLSNGDSAQARQLSDLAIREAEQTDNHPYLGHFYCNRALIAGQESQHDVAIELYQRGYQLLKDSKRDLECANVLQNLAQKYFDVGRATAARRAIASAERLAVRVNHQGVRVRARILLGEIEDAAGRTTVAALRWREAIEIAKQLNDRILLFKAEFCLFVQAKRDGETHLAHSLGRRLARLSHWLPDHLEELRAFRTMNLGAKTSTREFRGRNTRHRAGATTLSADH